MSTITVYQGTSNNWTEDDLSNSNKPATSNTLGSINTSYVVDNFYDWTLSKQEIEDMLNATNSDGLITLVVEKSGNSQNVIFFSKDITSTDGPDAQKPTLTLVTTNGSGGNNVPATGVTLMPGSITMDIGDMEQLTADVIPSTATNQSVTYLSNDEAIATVDNNGLVTAEGEGSTTITVTTIDGNHMATSTIMVNDPNNNGGGGNGGSGTGAWSQSPNNANNIFYNTGNVGIGINNPIEMLHVAGDIYAVRVRVSTDAGADFVFEDGYQLMTLEELEAYVKEHKHLPEIPSEREMIENDLQLGEFSIKLLQKVEELTLYMIELKKENSKLSEQMKELKVENKEMKKQMKTLSNQ
ncbi:MAG: Ig-like domain-containing protein [Bacteroidota bacterium]